MYSYTQLGKGTVNNYNHYYRNGLGAGNLVKNSTKYSMQIVLAHNQIMTNPMCGTRYPKTGVSNCKSPDVFKGKVMNLFNQTFDKLMEFSDPEDAQPQQNAQEPVVPPLQSFRSLNFDKFNSDMVYSSFEKPVLILN